MLVGAYSRSMVGSASDFYGLTALCMGLRVLMYVLAGQTLYDGRKWFPVLCLVEASHVCGSEAAGVGGRIRGVMRRTTSGWCSAGGGGRIWGCSWA